VVPGTVTVDDLETNLGLLKQYIDEPPSFEEGKSGADLLRRRAVRKSYDSPEDTSLSDSDNSESSSHSPRPGKRRKRRALDDEEIAERLEKRRLADLEKKARIKSAAKIVDSDDDEDAEKEFFARERELRFRMAEKSLAGSLPDSGTRKPRARKQRTLPVVHKNSMRVENGKEGSSDGEIEILEFTHSSPLANGDAGNLSDGEEAEGVRPSKRRRAS
jgi:replication fork protection complex subunit Tof1/Swi1